MVSMIGKRFARLTVVARVKEHGERLKWKCLCDCGGEKIAYASHLKRGATRSCGCLAAEVVTARNVASAKHGMWKSNEFAIWGSMIGRCHCPTNKAFDRYGGLGIAVCPEWREDFIAFYTHIGPRPSRAHSVDRIKNDRGYEPGNVRWATAKEQQNNRRINVVSVIDGQRLTATQIGERYGLNPDMIMRRIHAGRTGASLIAPPDRGRQFR